MVPRRELGAPTGDTSEVDAVHWAELGCEA